MSLLSSYGDHFIVGLSGVSLNETDRRVLSILRPAGIILFAYNFAQGARYREWHGALCELLREAGSLIGREKFFISIDHEGGRVHRLPPPVTHFPSAMEYSNSSKDTGRVMAAELRSLGINLAFAPVLDIHSNPSNPVIGQRAFGTTPADVIKAALPFAKALLDGGIMCCGKHFPGHGDTSSDSHLELPVVHKTFEQLSACELKPFRAAARAGFPFMMTAHILFPQIDASYPATTSAALLSGILREKMKFRGIVITDDLNMKAVRELFEKGDGAVRGIKAGCDMFCASRFSQPDSEVPLLLAEKLAEAEVDDAFTSSRAHAEKRIRSALEKVAMHRPYMLESLHRLDD